MEEVLLGYITKKSYELGLGLTDKDLIALAGYYGDIFSEKHLSNFSFSEEIFNEALEKFKKSRNIGKSHSKFAPATEAKTEESTKSYFSDSWEEDYSRIWDEEQNNNMQYGHIAGFDDHN